MPIAAPSPERRPPFPWRWFAATLGIIILREPFTWRYALGLLLTIAGVALIVLR